MATPRRSFSMDALRRNALTVWPGMTIFWIGDLAHQGSVSGHNPDDYPPLRAELTDSDTVPEVRALDFMIGARFSTEDGWKLVNALTKGADRHRVYYVIYRSTIWRRATGFRAESYGGDNHYDHVHVSGYVADDDNGRDWTSVLALGRRVGDMANVYRTPVGYYVSDGLHRRGPIRTKAPYYGQTTTGMNLIELTEEQRVEGGYDTWDRYLDAVAGPSFPPLVCNCNCNEGSSGVSDHVHETSGTTGPPTPVGE